MDNDYIKKMILSYVIAVIILVIMSYDLIISLIGGFGLMWLLMILYFGIETLIEMKSHIGPLDQIATCKNCGKDFGIPIYDGKYHMKVARRPVYCPHCNSVWGRAAYNDGKLLGADQI